jgi:hypothetical protein
LRVAEYALVLPSAADVDANLEPSFPHVASKSVWGLTYLREPSGYEYSGQDLVYSYASNSIPLDTNVPLNVLCATSGGAPVNVTLLRTVSNPRIIVPQQEPVFDSMDPFFIADDSRCFLVEPHYYTVSSSPTELEPPLNVPQWTTGYALAPFYHPFARTFLRELEIGGVDRFMRRSLQTDPQGIRGWSFDFSSTYQPTSAVLSTPPFSLPVEDVDFTPTGACSLYNWEVFYHAPMFVASILMQNRQYADAMKWLEYIFNPTDSSNYPAPNRYWVTRPLFEMTTWYDEQIQQLLKTDALSPGINDPHIADWMAHPYDPFRVANGRQSAYGWATVMRFLDNLIAWGDALFSQDTMESVNQAEQLYVMASMILGPRPERVRLPPEYEAANAGSATYASIDGSLDQFTDPLVDIENVIQSVPPLDQASSQGSARPALPRFVLLFCIPPNDTLLAYWDTVADRLDKIRNCKNITGAAGQPALYAPPINPLALIEAAASGATSFNPLASQPPVYRFATYLQKAIELTNDVRSLGASLLSALEKSDAEALAILRSGQEVNILKQTRAVKEQQITEAGDQIAALQRQQDVVQVRQNFYANVAFMNPAESAAISMQTVALLFNGAAAVVDLASGIAHAFPDIMAGGAGWAGTPAALVTDGGSHAGEAASSFSSALRGIAGMLSEGGQMSATMGSYQRRADEWGLQLGIANAEHVQLTAQITAATDRQKIATTELQIHDQQIANAQDVDDFLNDKFTNKQLYDYMALQLTNVYTQAYQLAHDLAQKANAAYNYELGNLDSFVQPTYWNDPYKGLQAGESLLLDLRRMEAAYLDANARELELTKHISLALTQPEALVALRETGSCPVIFTEDLFDRDHPGHYFRRLRSVAITVPCVTGPYTGVNATLTLGANAYRTADRISSASYPFDFSKLSPPANYTTDMGGVPIATSTGQNDAGLFDVNLRDERWLPFEGRGAISRWSLELDPRDNAFDMSTITDVVFHVRYTARQGSNAVQVRKAIKPQGPRQILVSVRDTFEDAYYVFFNPPGTNPTQQQTLSLPLNAPLFPYSNLGRPKISSIAVYFVLGVSSSGVTMSANLGQDGNPPPKLVPLTFSAGPDAGPSGLTWTLVADPGPNAFSADPGGFTLTLPMANVPPALQASGSGLLDATKVRDVLLVITYTIGP